MLRKPWWKRALHNIGIISLVLLALLTTLWSTAALYFDLSAIRMRAPTAALYLLAVSTSVWLVTGLWPKLAVCGVAFLLVLAWWLSLRPSNHRAWQPDVAETAWAEVNGTKVAIHNFRNCDYRAEFDYTCRWETKTFDLSAINGLDLFLTYWGSPWIAHPIVSFSFADGTHVAMSVETRKQVGETYSAIRGFFRSYELIYTISDERDLVRLRTNYRTGEEVFLYHTRATPQLAQAIFLAYLRKANALRDKPEWYNALTDNCTNNIAAHVREAGPDLIPRWDWRLLLNGKSDELLYQHGYLASGLCFAELKQRAHINPVARAANDAPDFSQRIRQVRPGFAAPTLQPASN
ncbi:MAG: DUF4105 domain-containing protein [Terriglobales bacterium]